MSDEDVKGGESVSIYTPDSECFLDWAVERSCQLRQELTPCRVMQRELAELESVLDDATTGGFVDFSDPVIQKLAERYRETRG